MSNNLIKSEMSEAERRFLNGIIRELKPKKILEVGVSAGGSSVVILNAIRDIEDAKLYSIDRDTQYYREPEKKSGYLVKELIPDYMGKWKLYTGNVSAKYLEEIEEGIDLCLLDTAHYPPGELLDILMILPFMKKSGIIVLHDINYNNQKGGENGIACNYLFGAVTAEKILPKTWEITPYPNIGAFEINEETLKYIDDLFFALSINWTYVPEEEDMEYTRKLILKYYGKEKMDKVEKIYQYNKNAIEIKKKEKEIELKKINNDIKQKIEKVDILRKNEMKKNETLRKELKNNEILRKKELKKSKELKKELNKQIKENQKIKSSHSWKITEPLRKIRQKIKYH